MFYANEQGVSHAERDTAKLAENYRRGRVQAQGELAAWERFLGR